MRLWSPPGLLTLAFPAPAGRGTKIDGTPLGTVPVATKEREEESALRYVLVRRRDQKAWCGPWAYGGERFSSNPDYWHVYRDRDAAESALALSTFKFAVTVEEFDDNRGDF